jgi:hypothetical protein
VSEVILRAFALVHAGGNKIEFPVAVKVGHGERVDDGLHRFFDDVLFPVVGLGVGGCFIPREATPAALKLRRREEDVEPAIAVEVTHDLDPRILWRLGINDNVFEGNIRRLGWSQQTG